MKKLSIVHDALYIHNIDKICVNYFRLFVLPLLECCSPVWMFLPARNLLPLDKVASGGRFLFPDSGS